MNQRNQRSSISQQQQCSLATGNTSFGANLSIRTSPSSSSFQKAKRALTAYIQPPRHPSASEDSAGYSPQKSLDQLSLSEYLVLTGDDSQTCPQERYSEMNGRLGSLFGSGWFFEWPGGKRPLNSTWPWADVKPSLLVLWGVCWMFVVAPMLNIPRNSQQGRNPNQRQDHRSPLQRSPSDYYLTQAGE
jgi:hypothetical protein